MESKLVSRDLLATALRTEVQLLGTVGNHMVIVFAEQHGGSAAALNHAIGTRAYNVIIFIRKGYVLGVTAQRAGLDSTLAFVLIVFFYLFGPDLPLTSLANLHGT